ncbi:MAG: ATP-grasp domain-containing protein [Candidatus Taylorbacteria bacterium]
MEKSGKKNEAGIGRIVYVTRDIERALGISPSEDYIIVTNRTEYSETIKKQFPESVILIDSKKEDLLDTKELLEAPEMEKIAEGASILVFKSNTLIESICKKNGWHLLNPSADLAEKIENKISAVEWLGELSEKYLPQHKVAATKDIKWQKEPLVIQWAHGHTGDGTILVNSNDELKVLQTKFPDRMARATSFVRGPSFTLNIVITPEGIYTGNISYQITGLPPFTDNPFSTIGNDWSLTHTLLSEKEVSEIEYMAREIGQKMAKDGWRGMCGIDVIRDEERGKIFLIEINARQPASTTFESFLQQENRRAGIVGITIFEAYITALLGHIITAPIIHINDGAQIIKRLTKNIAPNNIGDDVIGSLELAGYSVIQYPNTEYNSDQLRIQSMKGIMEAHAKFNSRGKGIIDNLS